MKRSKHSLSHFRNLTCDAGQLVPIGMTEVLPGDTFQHSTSLLVRASPLNTPVMHPVHVRVHHWFVPYRLIWTNFHNFITGGSDGNDATVAPYISIPGGGYNVGTLADHLGIPPSVGAGIHVSALPFRAYQLIHNEWYRDQDLVTPSVINLGDGADATTDVNLKFCAWEKGYFTSARPWTQKGPAVSLPLGTSAPVTTTGVTPHGRTAADATDRTLQALITTNAVQLSGAGLAATGALQWLNPTGLQADLSSATAATINSLRRALAIQR